MLTKEELCAQINALDQVEEQTRSAWVDHIQQAPAVDRELVDWLSGEMQKNIDATFDELGVTLDEKEPGYHDEYGKLVAEVDAAKNEFEVASEQIQKEIIEVQEQTSKELDAIQLQVVQQQIKNSAV